MKLLINSEPAEFNVESAENLQQILEDIQNWALKNNLYLADYVIKPETDKNPQNQLTADQIDLLDVRLVSQKQLLIENLTELCEYLDKTGMFLANKIQNHEFISPDETQQLQRGRQWILESLTSSSHQLGYSMSQTTVIKSLEIVEPAEDPMNYVEILATVKNTVMEWRRQLRLTSYTEDELKSMSSDFIASLPEININLEMIASDLTAGEQSRALSKLDKIVNYIAEGISVVNKLETNSEICRRILALLQDLTEALFRGDTVTAADIIDFDIREELDRFIEATIG